MAYFKATYYNGYCGCDIDMYFLADDIADVEFYMSEGLYDYAEDYFDACVTCDEDEDRDELWDSYYEDCDFIIFEKTQAEIEEEYDGEVIDLTN